MLGQIISAEIKNIVLENCNISISSEKLLSIYSKNSFEFFHNSKRFILKIFLDLDSINNLKLAENYNIAPQAFFRNETKPYFIIYEDKSLDLSSQLNHKEINDLKLILEKLRKNIIFSKKFDPLKTINNLLKPNFSDSNKQLIKKYSLISESILKNNIFNSISKNALHGDLHQGNIIKINQKIFLIDFDYCSQGIIGWDEAYFLSYQNKEAAKYYYAALIDEKISNHFAEINFNIKHLIALACLINCLWFYNNKYFTLAKDYAQKADYYFDLNHDQ